MQTDLSPLEQSSSADSVKSLTIGDYEFCSHGLEVCQLCDADYRSDNAFTAGLDPIDTREPITVDFSLNKDGIPQCKRHKAADCNSCFGFKKQLTKLNADAKKQAKKGKGQKMSNFV